MAIDILGILTALRPWVFVAGPAVPAGGRLYVVVAAPTNVYAVTAVPTNAYTTTAVPTNSYTTTARPDMATELPVRFFRGEGMTIRFNIQGVADPSGMTFRWQLLSARDNGTVLAELTSGGGITVADGFVIITAPGGADAVTDREPGVYYHCCFEEGSDTQEIVGPYTIAWPRASLPAP